MSHSLYEEQRDVNGKGSWWQLADPKGYYYTFRRADGYFYCFCSEHTVESPGKFESAKAMEAHLRGKNKKASTWPYQGPEPVVPYTVSLFLTITRDRNAYSQSIFKSEEQASFNSEKGKLRRNAFLPKTVKIPEVCD